MYRVLDEQGKPIGVPIKASDFYNKPTLKFVEEKYAANQVKRSPHKARIKNAVDKALLREKSLSLQKLMKVLERQGIHTVLRQNKEGLVYGITYVDHQTKCVFNGSGLGKQYSAKAIQERCIAEKVFEPDLQWHPAQKRTMELQPQAEAEAEIKASGNDLENARKIRKSENIWDLLTRPENVSDYLPYDLKKKRKKKKKKKKMKLSNTNKQ